MRGAINYLTIQRIHLNVNTSFFLLSGESLDDEYGQEVPVRKPGEKVTGPPILPPHLLQVILNKDIPAHVCILINAF